MSTYDYIDEKSCEPPLKELMSEPIVQLLMQRDRVKERDLWPMLRQTGERLHYFMGFSKVS